MSSTEAESRTLTQNTGCFTLTSHRPLQVLKCTLMLRSSNTVYISFGAATNGERSENMPKLLHARAPQDTAEEQKVHKLANSPHAPGYWIIRARMIAHSWVDVAPRPSRKN
jgi:hypothetical protein